MLAALQILSECRARMRGSSHGRLLVELAVMRVARLENLSSLGALVERLVALESSAPVRGSAAFVSRRDPAPPGAASVSAGTPSKDVAASPPVSVSAGPISDPPASAPKRKPKASGAAGSLPPAPTAAGAGPVAAPASTATAASVVPQPAAGTEAASKDPLVPAESARDLSPPTSTPARDDLRPLDLATAREVWPDLVKKVGPSLVWRLNYVEPIGVAGPDVLVIAAKPGYNLMADACGTEDALLEISQGLQRLLHRSVTLKYERSTKNDNLGAESPQPGAGPPHSLSADPMVQKVVELFEARPLKLDYGDEDG
jgi:DNA polymerase-3 subunit gamma/tau